MLALPQNWQSNCATSAHIPAYARHLPAEGGTVIVCWSLKGGSGTTVVSAALALTLAQRNNSTVRIVDLAGDIPSALGIAEPSGEGVTNWCSNHNARKFNRCKFRLLREYHCCLAAAAR